MNRYLKILVTSVIALAVDASHAAGIGGVEHTTQTFLETLAKSGGPPIETLSPVAARTVLVNVQAGAKLAAADVSEKTINVNRPRKTCCVMKGRPMGASSTPPVCLSS
jgi:acetyl esterase